MRHANFNVGSAAVADLLTALREKSDHDLPYYTSCVSEAFSQYEPVFTRERYADFFMDCAATVPGWVAGSVLANGKKESDGAIGLFRLWKAVDFDKDIEAKILFHVYDEARHSRLFVKLAWLAFPKMIARPVASKFAKSLIRVTKSDLVKSEDLSVGEDVLVDHLVQMNMGEIRTRINVMLMAPVVHEATLGPSRRAEVRETLAGLISDEEVHVSYTARYLEDVCRDGGFARVRNLFSRRLRDFDAYTRAEIEAAVVDYGQGRYPDLLNM